MPKETSLQMILDSEQRVIRNLLQEMKRNNATLRDLWATHKKLVEDQQQLLRINSSRRRRWRVRTI